MDDEQCWICGSHLLKKTIMKTQHEDIIVIKCESCLADLISIHKKEKHEPQRLPWKNWGEGKDGI